MIGIDDIGIGIGVSALAAWLASCGAEQTKTNTGSPLDAMDEKIAGVVSEGVFDSFVMDGPPDADMLPRGSIDDTASVETSEQSDVPPPVARPPQPIFPLTGTLTAIGEAPCGQFGSVTDLDEDSDGQGIGVCTDFAGVSYLFTIGATNDAGIGALSIQDAFPLTHIPDQIYLPVESGKFYVGGQDPTTAAWGWSFADVLNQQEKWHSFPEVNVKGETFLPTFAKGLTTAEHGLFIATSNLVFDADGASYKPGTLLRYDLLTEKTTAIATSGTNPTSVGLTEDANDPRVAVVNTGPLNVTGETVEHSILDVVDAKTGEITQTIELPFGGFGVGGEIAIAGNRLAIGSADNSGRIVVLSVADLDASPAILTMPGVAGALHFISLVKFSPDGHYLIAGDFNTGQVAAWNVDAIPATQVGEPIQVDADITDYSGIGDGVWIGGALVLAVGDKLVRLE